MTAPISLAVTGALAVLAGPVLLITLSGIGLMAVGAAAFVAALAQERTSATAAST